MGLGDRITASVADVRAHAQRLVQLNVELLKAEMQKKGQQYGAAVGLLVGCRRARSLCAGLPSGPIVVALDLVLPLWLSLLIVTLALFVIVAILIAVGRSKLRQAKTPAPQGAIGEAQNTVGQLRGGVKKTLDSVGAGATKEQTTATATSAPPPSAPGPSPKEGS